MQVWHFFWFLNDAGKASAGYCLEVMCVAGICFGCLVVQVLSLEVYQFVLRPVVSV